jgi:hypothetical protein
MKNPFSDEHPELLHDLWTMPTTRSLPRVATTERFTALLASLAANSSVVSIKKLTQDRLPFEFFAQKDITMSLFTPVFESLTTLTLALDYSDMPNNLHSAHAFRRMANALQTATSLQNLELEFQGRRKVDISPLLSSFTTNNYVFQDLAQLTLRGIIIAESEFGDFIIRQKHSLKQLHLGGYGVTGRHQPPNGGVHMSTGSFQGLFARLNSEMKFQSLKVQGDVIGMESNERWILTYATEVDGLWEYVMD